MTNVKKTRRSWGSGIATVLLCLAAIAEAAAEPSPLPELKPVAIEVDITSLPASEQAALVPILRAARDIGSLYTRQVWPGSRALIRERHSAKDSAAQAELDALNFFKGPWGPTGTAFIGGVSPGRPIGDFYPSGTPKHDIDIWLATRSEPDRKRALDSFPAIERGQNGAFEVVSYARHYKDAVPRATRRSRVAMTTALRAI
jgi:hypothetical protein